MSYVPRSKPTSFVGTDSTTAPTALPTKLRPPTVRTTGPQISHFMRGR